MEDINKPLRKFSALTIPKEIWEYILERKPGSQKKEKRVENAEG